MYTIPETQFLFHISKRPSTISLSANYDYREALTSEIIVSKPHSGGFSKTTLRVL